MDYAKDVYKAGLYIRQWRNSSNPELRERDRLLREMFWQTPKQRKGKPKRKTRNRKKTFDKKISVLVRSDSWRRVKDWAKNTSLGPADVVRVLLDGFVEIAPTFPANAPKAELLENLYEYIYGRPRVNPYD